jgi:hypothetical protein
MEMKEKNNGLCESNSHGSVDPLSVLVAWHEKNKEKFEEF